MFVLRHLINAFAFLFDQVCFLYIIVVILRAVFSWVGADPWNPIVRFVHAVTEPVLYPFRRLLPPERLGGVDLSPIWVILLVGFLQRLIVPILGDLAARVG